MLIAVVAVATACAKPVPDFCDETTVCADPAKPFCDLNGQYAASDFISNTCIPAPWDAGAFDASMADARPDAAAGASPDAAADARPDASVADASLPDPADANDTPITDEFIGEPCAGGSDCGGLLASGDYVCLANPSYGTSAVCASRCFDPGDCSDGYTGSGSPGCILSDGGSNYFCAVQCLTGADCPAGSDCILLSGSAIKICYGAD